MPISMILLSFLFLTGNSMVKQFVTGDSMVKHLHGWEMSKNLNVNCKAKLFLMTVNVIKRKSDDSSVSITHVQWNLPKADIL